MDAKRFATGTIVGAIVLHVTGWLIFDMAFGSFYAANAGSATGVDRETRMLWAMAVGNAAYAALIVYTMSRGPVASIADGAKIGAIVGCLLWLTVDMIFFGSTNLASLTRTLVDPLLEIVHGGVAGGAIAAVMTRK